MTDCLYYAYVDAIIYYGHHIFSYEKAVFAGLRRFAQGGIPIRPADQLSSYTWGGVAPWIVKCMGVHHGFYHITPYTMLVSKEHYTADAPTLMARNITANTDFVPVEKFYDIPAIYLLLNAQHALFSLKTPRHGTPVMSIVFQK